MAAPENSKAGGRAAFQHPSFVLFQTARFCMGLAMEMQSVAVGWQVYEITKRPLDLGLVGLVRFLPGILFSLFLDTLQTATIVGNSSCSATSATD